MSKLGPVAFLTVYRPLTLKVRWTSFADFFTDWLFPYFLPVSWTDFSLTTHRFYGEHLSYLNKTNWSYSICLKSFEDSLFLRRNYRFVLLIWVVGGGGGGRGYIVTRLISPSFLTITQPIASRPLKCFIFYPLSHQAISHKSSTERRCVDSQHFFKAFSSF